MSRFDIDYDGTEWDFIRWQGAKKQAFASKYGKERLRELEAALLALPNKRLISGHLIEPYDSPAGWVPSEAVTEPGDVCAVGAFCAYKKGEGEPGEWIGVGVTAQTVTSGLRCNADGVPTFLELGKCYKGDLYHTVTDVNGNVIHGGSSAGYAHLGDFVRCLN